MTNRNTGPEAAEMTPQRKLKWCLGSLGGAVTSLGLGANADKASTLFGDEVPAEIAAQVDLLYDVVTRVSAVYDSQTARSFLRASNPFAGDRSLLEFIAMAGTDPETAQQVVNGAVTAFID